MVSPLMPATSPPPAAVESAGVVGVLGHYGAANLGDEAIVAATLSEFRTRLPGWKLVGISMHPRDTAARHGIDAWPLRRSARSPATTAAAGMAAPAAARVPSAGAHARRRGVAGRAVRSVLRAPRAALRRGGATVAELRFWGRIIATCRRLDLLVVTGSNQFLDNFGGAGGFPRTLLMWTLAARVCRIPVAFISVGAGPLEGRLSRGMIRLALRCSAWHSYRDEPSRMLVEGPGHDLGGRVYPDLALALASGRDRDAPPLALLPARDRRIGINVMPVFDGRYWPTDRPEQYRAYIDAVAGFIGDLQREGERPFLFATQPADQHVIDDILQRLHTDRATAEAAGLVVNAGSVDELMALLAETDAVVATRFHGTVLALALNRPVLAICYHRKTADVMATFGVGEHVLDFADVNVQTLKQGLAAVLADVGAIRERQARELSRCGPRLAEQFDAVAAIARSKGPLLAPEGH